MLDRWSPRAVCQGGAPSALQPIPPTRLASKSVRPIGQPSGRAGLPARPVGQLGRDAIPLAFQALRFTHRVSPASLAGKGVRVICQQVRPSGLPTRPTGRLARKPSRALCCKSLGRAPKNLPPSFLVEDRQRSPRNANDRQKCQRSPQKNNDESTIDNDRRGSNNDSQRWTTIGPRESTHVQRCAHAKGTIFFPETHTDEPTSAPHRGGRSSGASRCRGRCPNLESVSGTY